MVEHTTPGSWLVYIIVASDGSYYTGVCTDLERRFREHATRRRGARYFNGRLPIAVVYRETGHTRRSACRRETEIKSWRRARKAALIAASQ